MEDGGDPWLRFVRATRLPPERTQKVLRSSVSWDRLGIEKSGLVRIPYNGSEWFGMINECECGRFHGTNFTAPKFRVPFASFCTRAGGDEQTCCHKIIALKDRRKMAAAQPFLIISSHGLTKAVMTDSQEPCFWPIQKCNEALPCNKLRLAPAQTLLSASHPWSLWHRNGRSLGRLHLFISNQYFGCVAKQCAIV